ncbi:hypothetical protein AB0I90_31700 [Micromonospora wenchangensis]|uniref:hypothetical protein n=1 Tax=Micromonospora wenchangensis TaxID=1185415 RepID=UPI0033C388C8
MTAPTVLDTTVVLDRYRAGLRAATDTELERRAATVAALPGRLATEMRHLIDAEREYRHVVRRPASPPVAPARLVQGRVALAAGGVTATSGAAVVLVGRALAEHADRVPQALVYSPAVAAGVVVAVVGGTRLARWVDEHRHPLAVDVDEDDLDPCGRELLARVRAGRRARGEVC